MRKEHPGFRMQTAKQIVSNLKFIEGMPAGVIAYTINSAAVGDKWKKIFVAFNGTGKDVSIAAQQGKYKCFVAGNMVSETIGGYEGYWRLPPYSCTILYQ
jgi:pullulanase